MTSEAILAELRALPGAPARLRERVRALPEPKPRVAWAFPHLGLRRASLVLAPAVLAVAFGAAALHGLLADSPHQRTASAQAKSAAGEAHLRATATTPTFDQATPTQTFSGATGTRLQQGSSTQGATALPPSATRLNKYEAWLRIR